MSRFDECLRNKKTGMLKPTKKVCRNNCKRSDCKYIGNRYKELIV